MKRQGTLSWERGNIAPLAIASVFVLFCILALSIDQAVALAAKSRQENALDGVRDSCMTPARAFVAKNSELPGRDIASGVGELLREAGFEGEVDVWFFESPERSLPSSRRLWVIAIQVREDSPTMFAHGLGIDSIPVASTAIVIAEPFSDTVTWRPDDSGNGRYSLAATAESPSFVYERLDDLAAYPGEVREAVRSAGENVMKGDRKGDDG